MKLIQLARMCLKVFAKNNALSHSLFILVKKENILISE